MPKLTMGLPKARKFDDDIKASIALYTQDIDIRERTLIARVDSAHDMTMLVDALQSDRLLGRMRWVNYNSTEDHP